MSGGGGQPKTTTSTTNSAPWTAQQPYLKGLFSSAQGLEMNPDGTPKAKDYYPGSTYAGMAPESSQALTDITKRATDGSPVLAGANQYATDVLGGKYLNQTAPGWDAVVGRAEDAVNANYAKAGRTNSGYHDKAVADSIGNLAYQDYQAQLDRMTQVAGQAPGLAQADYVDPNALNAVGQQRQQEGQNVINSDVQRFNYEQQAPEAALQAYQDFINGNYGGSTSSVQPYFQQPDWMNYLGAGLGIAGAASSFF